MSSPSTHGEDSSGGPEPGTPSAAPASETSEPASAEPEAPPASPPPDATGPATAGPETAAPDAVQPEAPPRASEPATAEPEAPPAAPPPVASEPGTTDDVPTTPQHSKPSGGHGPLRILAILVILGGLILMVAGAFTWFVVRDQLSDEKITVSDDAARFAGDDVNGPFTAYEQARVINKHALEASDGLTYAELDQDDPRRDTVMTASFLRASLYTSVVSFGVAFFAFGMGILMILVGWALLSVNKRLRTALT
jgi:hypothetical protein